MKTLCSMISAVSFLLLVSSCTCKNTDVVTLTGKTMGTTYSIKYVDQSSKSSSEKIHELIEKKLVRVNDVMSTYFPESELSKLNKADANVQIKLSDELNYVLAEAFQINKISGGIYDVSVGPLVNLWGFGPNGPRHRPTKQQIEERRALVGPDKFIYDQKSATLTKKFSKSYIDLSSIAKGYGVDEVANVLKNNEISNYMVEIGGEITTSGSKNGLPWKIAVQSPKLDDTDYAKVLSVNNISMATSGNYRNFFVEGGRKFSHTIDVKTGVPVSHTLASVTVLSPDNCMKADGLATALLASGPEAAVALAKRESIMAIFIIVSEGKAQVIESDAFIKFQEQMR